MDVMLATMALGRRDVMVLGPDGPLKKLPPLDDMTEGDIQEWAETVESADDYNWAESFGAKDGIVGASVMGLMRGIGGIGGMGRMGGFRIT